MVPLSVLDLAPVRAGATATRRAARSGRSRAAHRAARLSALLVRRASRHGEHRQLGAGDPDRAHRVGDHAAACRLGRHHAAEPFAAARGRGVSHARGAAPGPDRSRDSAARPAPIPPHRARCARSTANSFPTWCASCWRCRGARFPPIIRSDRCAWCPADVRAAADLGARLERRDGGVCRIARSRATASRGTSAPIRRSRRFARIASTSCPRSSFPRHT